MTTVAKKSLASPTVRDMGVVIRTDDHFGLIGRLLTPYDGVGSGERDDKIAAVLHPATGVDYNLYRKFGEFLVEEYGWPVLIYDFRGTGLSAFNTDRTNNKILMTDWMLKDVPAADRWMRDEFPDHKLVAIAHSVGAHGQVAVQGREESVDAMAMIASHAGITNTVRGVLERLKVWNFFNVLVPLSKRFLGYVPTELIGFGKQLPMGVLRQWARWSNNPGYFFADPQYQLAERFQSATGPILSVVFSDDPWAHREACDFLTDQMVEADVEKWDVQVGRGKDVTGPVGHMGFYRSRNKKLWRKVAEWVREQVI